MISNTPQLCLIGSLPSTGSTLFSHFLSKYKNIFIGPELGFFSHPLLWYDFNLYKYYALKTNFFEDFGDDSSVLALTSVGIVKFSATTDAHLAWYDVSRSEIINELKETRSLFEYINRLRLLFRVPPNSIWFEKTPQNIYSLNLFLRSKLLNPKALICTRSFFDTFVSYRTRVDDDTWVYDYLGSSLSSYYSCVRNCSNSLANVEYHKLVKNNFFYTDQILSSIFGPSFDLSRSSNSRKNIISSKSSGPTSWSLIPTDKTSLVEHSFDDSFNGKSPSLSQKANSYLIYLSLSRYIALENLNLRPEKSSFKLKDRNIKIPPLYILFSFMLPSPNAIKRSRSETLFDSSYFDLRSSYVLRLLLISWIRSLSQNLKRIKLFLITLVETIKVSFRGFVKAMLFSLIYLVKSIRIILGLVKTAIVGLKDLLLSFISFVKCQCIKRIAYFYPLLHIAQVQYLNKKYLLAISPLYLSRKKRLAKIKYRKYYNIDSVLCTATDGRISLVLLQCSEVQQAIVKYDLNLKFVVSVSTFEDFFQLQLEKERFPFLVPLIVANRPLGRKWQETVSYVKNYISPFSLIIIGSDDIVSASYIYNGIRQVEHAISDKGYVVMPYYWHAYDSSSKNIYHLSYLPTQKIALGAGRVFPAHFLDSFHWKIFDPSMESQLDNKAYYLSLKYMQFEIISLCPDQGILLSIKSKGSTEMNPLDAILKASTIEYKTLDEYQRSLLISSFSSPAVQKLLTS